MPSDNRLVCALIIGHKHSSPGAVNEANGTSEFEFNDDLAKAIETRASNVRIQRVYRRTYNTLPGDINELAPDFAISLHCNAFNKTAKGCEVLYYHRSQKGQAMAEILSEKLFEALKTRNRGAKPRSTEDRGGFLLKYVEAPCVIAEPFFIDNDDELANAVSRKRYLIKGYLEAIDEIADLLAPRPTIAPVLQTLALVHSHEESEEAPEAPPLTDSAGWTSALAHQTSIDHWARTYPDGYGGVLRDPQVKDMTFFNAEVSAEVRRNEMRIVVGGFLAFHAALRKPSQPGGISEDEAFNLLVSQFTVGECRLSLSGYAADSVYLYQDEESA